MQSIFLAAALFATPAHALSGNDYLYLVLADGIRVKGWYYGSLDGVLTVSGDGRLLDVSVDAIASVVRNGEPWPLSELLADVAIEQAKEDAWRLAPPPHPPGWLVVSGNMACCGLGHAALGDGRGFARYAIIDAVLLGAAAYAVLEGPGWGLAVPVVGLDIGFRIYASGDALRATQRRRARLGLRAPRSADSALPRTRVSPGLTETSDRE
ncbi:MAG: hypothetical protein CL927_08705 [Deltaproteobacteria bacterium]|nr:hypothetical protein [Deltaproteobacteria bacterium]HCH62264.1 hypothetical protein [Deltaproteobacteria bacterium]